MNPSQYLRREILIDYFGENTDCLKISKCTGDNIDDMYTNELLVNTSTGCSKSDDPCIEVGMPITGAKDFWVCWTYYPNNKKQSFREYWINQAYLTTFKAQTI